MGEKKTRMKKKYGDENRKIIDPEHLDHFPMGYYQKPRAHRIGGKC